MALQHTITLDSGLVIENAYLKINSLIGNKQELQINLDVFVSEAASTEKPFVIRKHYNFVPNNEESSLRWDKQGYEYLKTLEEFQGASDV